MGKVEYWNHFARRRIDLFGIIDEVAVNGDDTLAVQSTTYTHVSARKKKALDSEKLYRWLEGGGRRFEIWGWKDDWNVYILEIV